MPDRVLPHIHETARTLSAALAHYWPAVNGQEQGEANALVHLGSALLVAGFHVYSQVPESGGGRVDLLAAQPATGIAIAVEGKRLWNSPKAEAMARDLARMSTMKLASPLQGVHERYALLEATTWGAGVPSWWSNPTRPSRPAKCREDRGWSALGAQLQSCDLVDAIALRDKHHLLFAIKRLEPGLF